MSAAVVAEVFAEGSAVAGDGAHAFADDAAGLYGVLRSTGAEDVDIAGALRRARAEIETPSPLRLMAALREELRALRPSRAYDCYGTLAGVDDGQLVVAHLGRCHAALVEPEAGLRWLTSPQQSSWWSAELAGVDTERARRFLHDRVVNTLVVKSHPTQVHRGPAPPGAVLLLVTGPIIVDLEDEALAARVLGRDPRDAARDLVRRRDGVGRGAVVVTFDAP